jgi:acrylyl-CoA reductase (NADPH)
MEQPIKALLVTERDGKFEQEIVLLPADQLPENELTVRVHYSSINYKDALSASGNRGVTRNFPHIPGIDAAGVVVRSSTAAFRPGDQVVVTGFDMGMNTWGGFAEQISVPASWAIPLPEGLSLKEAMYFGTAGLTAALAVSKLIAHGLTPSSGAIAISGASGGVGSFSAAILSKLGFDITAISGKTNDPYLNDILGLRTIVSREDFIAQSDGKPLGKSGIAGGIDAVGGPVLSGMLKVTAYHGIVAACGNAATADLHTSVFPFILRGVTLTGIETANTPIPRRIQVWQQLASEWKPDRLQDMAREILPEALPEVLKLILEGKARGRYVVDLRGSGN